MENHVEFDLLVDPDGNFKHAALGIAKLSLRSWLSPTARKRYLKWKGKTRQGLPAAGLSEPPGVAIIDTDGVIRYLYAGETLGDYPPIEDVLDALRLVS